MPGRSPPPDDTQTTRLKFASTAHVLSSIPPGRWNAV